MKARQLPSGSWNCRIMVGGQSYSFTHPDKRTVMRMASDFADETRRRIANPTLLEAMQKYVHDNSERLSPSTVRSYNGMIRMVEARNPSIASKRISALTEQDVLEIVRPLRTLKTKRNYVNFLHVVTGRDLRVKLHGTPSKEIRVPTDLEILGLIELFKNTEMEVPVMLGAYGGLRRGEICALTMQDIDGDYVHITKDMVRDDFGQWIIKPPKTPTSVRTVLLPHFVIERIRERGHITALTPQNVSDRFWKTQLRHGIDRPYCFHSLRHYSASYLHSVGIPDAYILARGGWSTPHIMQTVYRHALSDKVREMDEKAVSAFQIPFQIT